MRAPRYLTLEDGLVDPFDFGLAVGPDDPGIAEAEEERERETEAAHGSL